MKAGDIQRDLSRVRSQEADLRRVRAQFATERKHALAATGSFYRQQKVDDASAAVARADVQLDRLSERIAALEDELPTAEAVKAAKVEARSIVAQIEDARKRFDSNWSTFMKQLEQTETTARELSAAIAEARKLIPRLTDLAARFGLELEMPAAVRPDGASSKQAALVAMVLEEAARGHEARDVVERDLRAARKEVRAVSPV